MLFPQVDAEALSGRRVSFPQDFARPTIAVVMFDQHQRAALESWLPFIVGHVEARRADAYVIGALAHSMRMMAGMISTMMRAAVPADARDRTIPAYVDLDAFCAALGVTQRNTLHLLVVQPGGAVAAHLTGAHSDASAAALAAQLEVPA